MFYFKFFEQESKLTAKDKNYQNFPLDLKIDPNSEDLSYVALKGTTFKRKTMLEHKLEYIPREFAPNEFPYSAIGAYEKSDEDGDGPNTFIENSEISDRPKLT